MPGLAMPPASAGEVHAAVRALLDGYEQAEGLSADDYDATPRLHPMAEGKYLQSVAALRRSGLLGRPELTQRVSAGLARLRRTTSYDGPDGAAWGLGFPFRSTPEDEPFVITSAIVTASLLDLLPEVPNQQRGELQDLLDPALAWLTTAVPVVLRDGTAVPAFSPHLRFAVNNVIAYWSGVVVQAQSLDQPPGCTACAPIAAAEGVLQRYIAGVGWPYSDDSARHDLLHTCYIGTGLSRALPESEQLDQALLTAVTQFSGTDFWYDHFDAEPVTSVLDQPASWSVRRVRLVTDVAQVGFTTKARPWSIGELLVLAAHLSRRPWAGAVWFAQLRPLWTIILHQYLPCATFRHSMHLAHGLASGLEAVRAPGAVSAGS